MKSTNALLLGALLAVGCRGSADTKHPEEAPAKAPPGPAEEQAGAMGDIDMADYQRDESDAVTPTTRSRDMQETDEDAEEATYEYEDDEEDAYEDEEVDEDDPYAG